MRPDGHYQDIRYGNGVYEQRFADDVGRRQVRDWVTSTASGDYMFHREPDAAGRATFAREVTPWSVADLTYNYDPLGRLSQSLQIGGNDAGLEWYSHDALGNLRLRVASTSAGTREYTSDPLDPDRLCRYAPLASPGPCQFTYDGAGNVIGDTTAGEGAMDLRKLTYDSGQRLTSIHRGAVTADLTYGPLGRVRTTVTGPTPRQEWTFGSLVEKRQRADGKVQVERSIPGPLGIVASLRHDGVGQAVVYSHADHRGNHFFTDGAGQVVQTISYGPYGRVTADTGAGAPLTYSDDLWNGGDDLRELGVVLLGPRAYDPAIGRFLQRDPLIHTGSASTGNPYSFAFGDPINLSDPTGLDPCSGLCISTNVGGGIPVGFGAGVAAALGLGLASDIFGNGSGPTGPRAPTAVPSFAGWANGQLTPYLAEAVARDRAAGPSGGIWGAVNVAADAAHVGYNVASRVAHAAAVQAVKYGTPIVAGLACAGPQAVACVIAARSGGAALGQLGADLLGDSDLSVSRPVIAGAFGALGAVRGPAVAAPEEHFGLDLGGMTAFGAGSDGGSGPLLSPSDFFTLLNPDDPANGILATVDDGILSTVIEATGPTRMRGAELFQSAVEHFGRDNIHGVRGAWFYGDNLATVNRLTAGNVSLETAARSTFTGKMAARLGFETVRVIRAEGEKGAFTKVEVIFQ